MQLGRPTPSSKLSRRSAMPPPPPPSVSRECSMCGDVGFHKELFRCTSCKQRYQHRYCSSFYPNVATDEKDWSCDWCLLRDKSLMKKPSTAPKSMSTSPKRRHQDQVPAAKQSPLECLLVVAAENLERGFNESPTAPPPATSLKGGRIRRVMSMPASIKKFPEVPPHSPSGAAAAAAAAAVGPATNNSSSSPKLHKRKRCGDMDREELRLRPPPPAAAKPPFSASPRGVGGRRYRLLSEVLC